MNDRYRFRHVARMEWIKLRSLRSMWWALAVTAAGASGISIAAGAHAEGASDPTNDILIGIVPGLLLSGVLGVMVITAEYTSGMIRATLAAIPNRPLVLAAKAAVLALVALAAGEAAAFTSFLAGRAVLPAAAATPALSQPGVLRAVVLSGVAFCLTGLMGLGLGAVIRHTAAAIAILVGGLFVAVQFVAQVSDGVAKYLPITIVGNSLAVARPDHDMLAPWTGFGMLCLYAAALLCAGGLVLARRDA